MGRDKARLPFRGAFLAEAVARAVELAAGSVTLVGDPDRYRDLGFPVIPDLHPGAGPLGGILTALAASRAEWNLVAACDMPRLSREFLESLLDAAEHSGADALIPTGPTGLPEPLCAVYSRRCRTALDQAFARGVRKVTDALTDARVAPFQVSEAVYFQNVNTPEDWAAHAE